MIACPAVISGFQPPAPLVGHVLLHRLLYSLRMVLSAEEIDAATSAWTWLGPLVGVVTGGVLGGLGQLVAEARRDRNARRATLMAVRREVYFQALDVVEEIRVALERFMIAASGRRNEEDCETEEERLEMRRRDEEAASAIEDLFGGRRAIHSVVIRVSAVGSIAVRRAIEAVRGAVDDYMDALFTQMTTDGIYRGAAAEAFRDRYASLSDVLSAAIRADLDVDRIINERV